LILIKQENNSNNHLHDVYTELEKDKGEGKKKKGLGKPDMGKELDLETGKKI
jgi:hypothetical protein